MFQPLRPSVSLSVQMKDSAKSDKMQRVVICISLLFLPAGYWFSPSEENLTSHLSLMSNEITAERPHLLFLSIPNFKPVAYKKYGSMRGILFLMNKTRRLILRPLVVMDIAIWQQLSIRVRVIISPFLYI